jgi:hypothetical protein
VLKFRISSRGEEVTEERKNAIKSDEEHHRKFDREICKKVKIEEREKKRREKKLSQKSKKVIESENTMAAGKWSLFANRFEARKPAAEMTKLDAFLDVVAFVIISIGYVIQVGLKEDEVFECVATSENPLENPP